MIVDFGEYKGQEVKEIFEKDPKYIEWLYTQKVSDEMKDEIRKFYKINLEMITFGKYKGRSVSEIYDLDLEYLLWLYGSDVLKKPANKHLKDEIIKCIKLK